MRHLGRVQLVSVQWVSDSLGGGTCRGANHCFHMMTFSACRRLCALNFFIGELDRMRAQRFVNVFADDEVIDIAFADSTQLAEHIAF